MSRIHGTLAKLESIEVNIWRMPLLLEEHTVRLPVVQPSWYLPLRLDRVSLLQMPQHSSPKAT